jgi:hypothetical protein
LSAMIYVGRPGSVDDGLQLGAPRGIGMRSAPDLVRSPSMTARNPVK